MIGPENIFRVVQVVPELSASSHGINDYARALDGWWKTHIGVATEFRSAKPNGTNACLPMEADTSFKNLHRTLKNSGQRKVEQRWIILFHFDYGSYGWWDIPVWLLFHLRRLKRAVPVISIALFFHEFHPIAPRRRKEKLTLRFSKHFLRRIIGMADLVICSNEQVQQQIRQLEPGCDVLEVPIFSTIGEPELDRACDTKDDGRWVVFGSTGNLPRSLRSFIAHLALLPTMHRPKSIDVIGGVPTEEIKALTRQLEDTAGVDVRYAPRLSQAECSTAFCRARYLFFAYFDQEHVGHPVLVMKSTVFAAANAHGVVTVFGNTGMDKVGVATGFPGAAYLVEGRFTFPTDVPALSRKLHAWYHRHGSIECAAKKLASALRLPSTPTAPS